MGQQDIDKTHEHLLAYASVLGAEQVVVETATCLARAGIPVMVLKGALLRKTVYKCHPESRRLCDVDVLIPQKSLQQASLMLTECRYRLLPDASVWRAKNFVTPWGLHLDLHGSLYDRFMFKVKTEDLFKNSSLDRTLFGVEVSIPHPVDIYAHLIGHFVKGRLPWNHPKLRDLPSVASYYRLEPDKVVHAICSAGLQRAARYTLTASHVQLNDKFAEQVLRELPSDPTGEWLSHLAQHIMSEPGSSWINRVSAVHSLNSSIPRSILCFLYHGMHYIRQRASRGC